MIATLHLLRTCTTLNHHRLYFRIIQVQPIILNMFCCLQLRTPIKDAIKTAPHPEHCLNYLVSTMVSKYLSVLQRLSLYTTSVLGFRMVVNVGLDITHTTLITNTISARSVSMAAMVDPLQTTFIASLTVTQSARQKTRIFV